MGREIKFIGYRLNSEGFDNPWVYGDLETKKELTYQNSKGFKIEPYKIDGVEVIPESIGQYLGINTEKDNVEIFEGHQLSINKSVLNTDFKKSKAGELMIEKNIDEYIINIQYSEHLSPKYYIYLKKDGKLLTENEYYGLDEENSKEEIEKGKQLYYQIGVEIMFLRYITKYCEVIGYWNYPNIDISKFK